MENNFFRGPVRKMSHYNQKNQSAARGSNRSQLQRGGQSYGQKTQSLKEAGRQREVFLGISRCWHSLWLMEVCWWDRNWDSRLFPHCCLCFICFISVCSELSGCPCIMSCPDDITLLHQNKKQVHLRLKESAISPASYHAITTEPFIWSIY